MTATRNVVAGTLAFAAAAWFAAVAQMQGMDMGTATERGSFSFFAGLWLTMMAAMMLPGAAPAIAHSGNVLRFVASYLALWSVVGFAVYLAYRPHGAAAAGAVTIAAGIYELTPLKRACRRRCRERLRSGLGFGVNCVGSSIGLMAMLAALGLMSVPWMAVVAVVISAQKLLPTRRVPDVALALAIVALGIYLY